mgnify:CR=1 FL=1
MKKNIVRKQSIIFMLALAAASMLAGCQKTDETRRENSNPSTSAGTTMSAGRDNSTGNAGTKAEEAGEELTGASALEVRFGDDGAHPPATPVHSAIPPEGISLAPCK